MLYVIISLFFLVIFIACINVFFSKKYASGINYKKDNQQPPPVETFSSPPPPQK